VVSRKVARTLIRMNLASNCLASNMPKFTQIIQRVACNHMQTFATCGSFVAYLAGRVALTGLVQWKQAAGKDTPGLPVRRGEAGSPERLVISGITPGDLCPND